MVENRSILRVKRTHSYLVGHALVRSVVSLLVGAVIACSATGERADAKSTATNRRESSSGAIASSPTPYHARALTQSGSISGRVLIDGDVPRDSTITLAASEAPGVCGASVPDQSLLHSGPTLGNAVVWVTDARAGRALPVERRFEIVHEHCLFTTRVITATVGSTINVRNEDPVEYRLRAVRDGGGGATNDTLGVFRMSDAGQVVPNDVMAKSPGLVRIDCAQHPWAKAWVAVFDHPYFAVTGTDGAFRIDSLPPGTYHLRVWHERAKAPVEQSVEVKAGSSATLELKLPLK